MVFTFYFLRMEPRYGLSNLEYQKRKQYVWRLQILQGCDIFYIGALAILLYVDWNCGELHELYKLISCFKPPTQCN